MCGQKGHGSGSPLPSRTAADFLTPRTRRLLSPTTVDYTGATLSPTTLKLPKKMKGKGETRKRTKEIKQRKIQSKAGPARTPRPLNPDPLSVPAFICPCSQTTPTTPPRVIQVLAIVCGRENSLVPAALNQGLGKSLLTLWACQRLHVA